MLDTPPTHDESHLPPAAVAVEHRESDSLSHRLALDRIRPFLTWDKHLVIEGESGVGKKFHAELLHSQVEFPGEFVEIVPETSPEVFRVILFDESRTLIEEMQAKRLPSLDGNSMLYLHNIDEFGIIPQTMLSRFLIQQSGQQSKYARTRVVVATSVPWVNILSGRVLLDSLMQSMQRFQVCRIPPLRERFVELPSLVQAILAMMEPLPDGEGWRIDDRTLEQLKRRHWYDNVRELKYVLESAAANAPGGILKLPESHADEIQIVWEMFRTIRSGRRLTIEQSLAELEKAVIERALVKYDFNQRKTARMLAMTEPNLAYRIKKFDIHIPSLK